MAHPHVARVSVEPTVIHDLLHKHVIRVPMLDDAAAPAASIRLAVAVLSSGRREQQRGARRAAPARVTRADAIVAQAVERAVNLVSAGAEWCEGACRSGACKSLGGAKQGGQHLRVSLRRPDADARSDA